MTLYERYEGGSDGSLLFSDISTTLPVAMYQSFTTGTTSTNNSHLITSIELNLKKAGTPVSDLTIELREWDSSTSKPSSTVLASEVVAKTSVTTSFTWVNCGDFANYTLKPSTKYAIVVRAGINTSGNEYYWQNKNAGGYSGGGCGSSTSDGNSFNTEGDYGDVNFRINGNFWRSVITDYQAVSSKFGSDVNATAISETYLNDFVLHAESILNVRTRHDWTSEFNSLSDSTKYILSEIVSCLAAIKVINFDTSTIGSLSAQRRIENLFYDAEVLIEAIRDAEVQTFISSV
jgi:hypothetical protein